MCQQSLACAKLGCTMADTTQQPPFGSNMTVVSAETEVNSSYSFHRLVPGQFCLPQPYQRARHPEPASPNAISDASGRPAKRARKLEAADGAADATTTPGSNHEQKHAQQADAAAEATAAAMEVISRAQALVTSMGLMHGKCATCAGNMLEQQHTSEQDHDGQAVATQQQLPKQQQGQQGQQGKQSQQQQPQQQRKQQRQARLEAGEDVDWVALASMAHILKPKLILDSDGRGAHCSSKLFNTLIANDADAEVRATAHEAYVLLPARSRFLMSDDRHMAPLLADAQRYGGYHLLVLDPPWENASVRRAAHYATLPPKRLLELPAKALLHQGPGSLVALWMTNRPRQHRLALEQLLPAWGLQRVAIWWWLKVTCSGEPVTPPSSLHRHPYEQLWLARPLANKADAACNAPGGSLQANGAELQQQRPKQREPPNDHVLVSVPGAHSVKPHLGRLLAPFVVAPEDEELRRCELFARGLAAGWTSWGNEVLALQGCHMFEQRC